MKRTLSTLFLLSVLATAAEAPKLSEVSKLRILNQYRKAIIAQVDFNAAQQRALAEAQAYNTLVDQEKEAAKLPKDSKFEVNLAKDEVTITLPPEEPKKP